MLLNLGRLGDIINLLPLAYLRSLQSGEREDFMVGQRFASILAGCSYVKTYRVNREPEHLAEVAFAYPHFQNAQVNRNPDSRRLTSSFAKESYRLIGELDKFGTAPTVFDLRNPEREVALKTKYLPKDGKPFVAVALDGVSSPFSAKQKVLDALQDYAVLDLCAIRTEFPFDLLALLDHASALVSIDTMHLWLARASQVPVVALLNDREDGWFASPPPPNAVASYGYSKLNPSSVTDTLRYVSRPAGKTILCIDRHGDSSRHRRAAETWDPDLLLSYPSSGRRSPKRHLPYLKDFLRFALRHTDGDDCVVWTNDDVQLAPGCLGKLHKHVQVFGACSVRRDPKHIGRELLAFSADWLRDHLDAMPDTVLAAPWFDLAYAAYIRQTKGLNSTMQNLHWDFFPAELPPGLLSHEDHPSSWLEHDGSVESEQNRKEFERVYATRV